MDLISFDRRLITENNFHDDNRPYRYEQNIQEQQNLFINEDNNNEEDDNNKEEYILEITHDPQSYLDTSSHRKITFNLPTHSDEIVQDATQNITSIRDTSVNVLSPTRTISNNTRNTTRSVYDPPSFPSAFQQSNKTIQSENNRSNNQQTSSQHNDLFNYSFFPPFNTNIKKKTILKIFLIPIIT